MYLHCPLDKEWHYKFIYFWIEININNMQKKSIIFKKQRTLGTRPRYQFPDAQRAPGSRMWTGERADALRTGLLMQWIWAEVPQASVSQTAQLVQAQTVLETTGPRDRQIVVNQKFSALAVCIKITQEALKMPRLLPRPIQPESLEVRCRHQHF